MDKKVTSLVIACTLLLAANLFLLTAHMATRNTLKKAGQAKKEELKKELLKERESVKKDIEEKYKADIVSYNAMAKRLELEKAKVKEFSDKIEQLEREYGKTRTNPQE